MPKLIDHHTKKQLIAQAAWKIILTQGMEGASVRNIAKEAGLSLGSLRYYFATQEELLSFARSLAVETMSERIEQIFQEDMHPKFKILSALMALLPDGKGGNPEIEVRLFFKIHSRLDRLEFEVQKDGAYVAVKNVMSNLVLLNLLKKNVDLNLETERLYALMDGLALDAMLRPGEGKVDKLTGLIIGHLNSICKEEIGDIG